jgi:hypothetical protein
LERTRAEHGGEVYLSKVETINGGSEHIANLQATVDKLQNAKYQIAVLSGKDGDQVSFYISDGFNTGNSMFQEQTRFLIT